MQRLALFLLLVAGVHALRHTTSRQIDVIYAEIGATLEICPRASASLGSESVRWQFPAQLRTASRSKTEEGTYCLNVFDWESVDAGSYKFEGKEVDSWSVRQEFLVVSMIRHRVWLPPAVQTARLLPKRHLPKIANVTWYRSDQKVVWCRVTDDTTVCDYDNDFKDRAVLDSASGELTLKESKQSDYGVSFTLRVNDQPRKWKEQFTILTIPVIEVGIEAGQTLHLDPEFIPHYNGFGTSQIANITWTHGDETIESTDTTVIDSEHGELTIANWKPPTHTSVFTVKLYDDHGGEIMKNFIVETIVRVQVEVGTVLYLDPEFSGEIDNITWKYGPILAVEHTKGVNVVYHVAFDKASSINTTNGKLMVSNWKPGDIFTVKINAVFLKTIVVEGVVRVQVGTTLYLDPKFDGKINSIVWNNGDASAVESSDGVKLVYSGVHKLTSKMVAATGKLLVSAWKPFNQPVFTVDINAGAFAAAFNVESIVRVEQNGDLDIDLGFAEDIRHMIWTFNGKTYVEFDVTNGAIFNDIDCAADSSWDRTTMRLTAKSWECDGTFNVVINKKNATKIYVVANVVYVMVGGGGKIEDRIVWKKNNAIVADSTWDNVTVSLTNGKLKCSGSEKLDEKSINVEINGNTMPKTFVVVGVRNLNTYDDMNLMFGEYVCESIASTRKCTLVCGGDAEGAEPVKYFWKTRENTWLPGTKYMDAEYYWSGFALDGCSMRNPVSERNLSMYR